MTNITNEETFDVTFECSYDKTTDSPEHEEENVDLLSLQS